MLSRRQTLAFLAASVVAAGCVGQGRRISFPAIEEATLVRVRIADQGEPELGSSAGVVAEIAEPAQIQRLLAFVNARRDGYYVPIAGAPIPEVRVEIRNGDELQSVFSSGSNFFQRAEFWSVRATPSELREFLSLIGVDPARLRFPPPA